MKIAFETYGDLYRWKGSSKPIRTRSPIRACSAGTVLKLEKPASPVTVEKNGEKYLIKSGDTLGTISKDVYGTQSKWKTLWENNKQMIHDPNRIFAGFYLYYQPDNNSPKSDSPAVTPAPMANAGAGGANTATTGSYGSGSCIGRWRRTGGSCWRHCDAISAAYDRIQYLKIKKPRPLSGTRLCF